MKQIFIESKDKIDVKVMADFFADIERQEDTVRNLKIHPRTFNSFKETVPYKIDGTRIWGADIWLDDKMPLNACEFQYEDSIFKSKK